MKYIEVTLELADVICEIYEKTIKMIYSRYYSEKIVDYFCTLHNRKRILEKIESGNMGVLIDGEIVGTGCYDGNHITGVYVLPEFEGHGYGSKIMVSLESNHFKKF